MSGSWPAPRPTDLARAAALLGCLAAAPAARAEPYIALRAGLQCAACHVNQTGGGMRNSFGVDYGLLRLPARPLDVEGLEAAARGELASFLRVGADLRAGALGRFAVSGDATTFETREGNVYLDLRLIRDRLRLYADERIAPGGAASREFVALLENLPGRLYLKAGRFFPPFGWRLLDDDAFIRSDTGFSFSSPDDGLEVGWQPGRFASSLAVTNGNGGAPDDERNKRVSMVSSWAWPWGRLGGSFSANRQGGAGTLLGGVMGGLKLGERLVVLGELDAGRDRQDEDGRGTGRRLLGFLEADLVVAPGWNLKAAYDYRDPDTSLDDDESDRVTAGAEVFALPYLQLRLLWRRTDRPPEVLGAPFEDEREVLLEIHLFL